MKLKKAKTAFKESFLPSNRKEVFFDVLKLRWRTFLLIGLFLLLGFLPILAACIIKDSLIIYVYQNDPSQYVSFYLLAYVIFEIAVFLLLFIFAIPISGSLRIIRQIVWGSEVFFKEDFIKGIKDNYKSLCFPNVLFGLILIIGRVASLYAKSDMPFYIIFGVFMVLIMPILLYYIYQSTIYTNSFKQAFYNSMLLYLKTAPIIIFCTFILFIGYGFKFIEIPLVKYICVAIYILVFVPYFIVISYLYSNSVFDHFINTKFYPDLVNKGMYKKK